MPCRRSCSPLPPQGEEQELINYGVLGGILCGLIAAYLWQRYYRISLPPYLAFFGGRRFVPIVTGFATMILAVLLAIIYPAFDAGLTNVGEWVAANSIIGGFVYGTANRLLIPLGLHHILNSVPWFILGDYTNPATGTVVHGDISRFLAGDKTAGAFMTGFFPIMMFALPAAALAIWQEAKFKSRKLVGGLMMTAALTSFLTGVTEPLEFAFMFVAWPLYVIHAVLTGTSMALANALGIKDGFGFSAGLFDYVLNFNIATKPLWLIVIGARVRRRLLPPVPLGDPPVEPAHARPRGRRRRLDRGQPRSRRHPRRADPADSTADEKVGAGAAHR